MEAWTRRALFTACTAALVGAGPAPAPTAAPEPSITPAAILPRIDSQVLGWYASGTLDDGETVYAPWTYDADRTTYTTSSDWFRRCGVSSTCTMYTACSNGYMVAAGGVSTSCGAGGSSGAYFCSYHILKTSLGASSQHTWYWCDQAPLTGVTFYEKEPAQPTATNTPSSTATSSPKIIAGDETSSSGPTASTPTSTPTSSPTQSNSSGSGGSSTNVGAIAGGVVGGVAALALIGAGIFYFMYRSRKTSTPSAGAPTGYAPPPNQPGFPASPNLDYATAYQANEAKPVGVQEGGYYNPQPYPQGPYDPHMSQYAGAPPHEAPAAPPPVGAAQPMPQEMPTSR